MGFFSKFKQAAQAAQQMADGDTRLSVVLNNQNVAIGDTLQGNITVTSTQPSLVSGFQINLFREEDTISSNNKQWVFNKETIPANLQLTPNEPQTFPFSFIVKDGLNDGLNYVPKAEKAAGITVAGVDPAVLPDPMVSYKHRLTIGARLNNSDFGPFTGVDIEFSYPSVNINL